MASETQTAILERARIPPLAQGIDRCGGPGEDAAFDTLHAAYQAIGGLARGDDLARLLEDRACGDYVSLARLIVAGRIFGFECGYSFWIPMFQFDLADLSVRPWLGQVLSELASEFDGWRLAAWFVEPNAWLQQSRPIDLIDSNLPEVVQAARADRFVAAG